MEISRKGGLPHPELRQIIGFSQDYLRQLSGAGIGDRTGVLIGEIVALDMAGSPV